MIRETLKRYFSPARLVNPLVSFKDNPLGPINFDFDTPNAIGAETAFKVAAFHACVRVLAESVASLPIHLMKVSEDGTKSQARQHPLYDILHKRPNSWQSSYEFRETLTQHVCTWGNAYALKVYRDGYLEELWPLHPAMVTPSQLSNNAIVYDYLIQPSGEIRRFREDQIVHVRYLSDNSYSGMVPMELTGGTIELAQSIDLYSRRFWANDARPGVIMETSQPVPEEALAALRNHWEKLHRGPMNARRTAVLPAGVSVKELSGASNSDSEMIAMRTFVVQEIARAMRVPCSMIGENSRSTYSNSEQEALSFVQNSLVAWCRRFESALERSLLDAMPGYAISLDVRGMLRGDSAARASYYTAGLQAGWFTINEVRRLEDLQPIDDPNADQPFVAANNMQPLSRVGQIEESEPVDGVQPAPQDGSGTGDRSVQSQALNGAQIEGFLTIVDAMASGRLTRDAAASLIASAFPLLDQETIGKVLDGTMSPTAEDNPQAEESTSIVDPE